MNIKILFSLVFSVLMLSSCFNFNADEVTDVGANNDYTCYNYSKTSSCSISGNSFAEASAMDGVSCTPWENGKSICSGNKGTDVYSRGSGYRCANWGAESRSTYSVGGQACQVEFIDSEAPTVSGGIEE